ncbi:MAG: glutathione-regulated potassium-efflux system protein KefB, partial [Xanthomonadales bacterium]|nr:glutathione-regulated potassium-efflux system protein KefB [Xanthomonadales bacterium]
FHSSLDMGRQAFEVLGVPPEQARQLAETFRVHDEALLREQHLLYDDEAALVTSSAEARAELSRLFEADARKDETPITPVDPQDV